MGELENIFKEMEREFSEPSLPVEYQLIANIEVGTGAASRRFLTNLNLRASGISQLVIGSKRLRCRMSLAVFSSPTPELVEVAYSQVHSVLRNQELLYERKSVPLAY